MTIKETIQKAVEGGYDSNWMSDPELNGDDLKNRMCLDPLFWQSLGKAMGWELTHNFDASSQCSRCRNYKETCVNREKCLTGKEWREQWHSFIDQLADGKTIESFFEQF